MECGERGVTMLELTGIGSGCDLMDDDVASPLGDNSNVPLYH